MDICIDFDGTVVTHEYPEIGKLIGAESVLKNLITNGHNLILFTMRHGTQLDNEVEWFAQNEIKLHGIQYNPTQSDWTKSNKAYGQLYIQPSKVIDTILLLKRIKNILINY